MFCSLFDPIWRLTLAASLPLLLALCYGDRLVAWLERRFREPLKTDSETLARLQATKRATPTMGGLFILAGIMLSLLLWADWSDTGPRLALLVLLGFGAIGAVDDLSKQRPGSQGLRAKPKLLTQCAVGAVVSGLLIHGRQTPLAIEAWLPLSGTFAPWLLTGWATLVMVSSSNAVNLADGLDGLAAGTVAIAATCLGLVAWLAADRTPQTFETCVLAATLVGSLLGFLRFNRHPARVFMGDTGSLPLGALLGFMALATGHELLWIVIGGVFVAEAISVMLQVGWFKWRKQRLFRCAPLHHHFQFLGWPERKIVARFWLAALVCAMAALAMLKLPQGTKPRADSHAPCPLDDCEPAAMSATMLKRSISVALNGWATEKKDTAGLDIESCPTCLADEPELPRQPGRPLHFVFAGGGTGGHLFPGLATADALREMLSDVRITFAGSGSAFERRHVTAAGYEYLALRSQPLKASPWAWPGFFAAHWQGRRQAQDFLREHPADVVVGLGGYASVPMARAAAARGVPLVLLEQNAVPGRANRWLARHAAQICLGFAAAGRHFPGVAADRLLVTGIPLRAMAAAADSSNSRPLLVICGGSGGARPLNVAVPQVLARMRSQLLNWRVLHQTGENGLAPTRSLYDQLQIDAEVVAFVHDLPQILTQASLAVCRAGGTTLAELAAAGVPAILCPYPFAADDHQRLNAEIFAASGAALLVGARPLESERGTTELAVSLAALLADPSRRNVMTAAAQSLARPRAAADVAQAVVRILSRPAHAACIDAESSLGV